MPFLIIVYLLAYLDRANLSVAKLQMQGELHFTDAVIGFGAGIFFLGYVLLEVPGSLICERWSARTWIARIMVSWGLVAALCGLIGTSLFSRFSPTHQFYWLRFALGAAEAGFFPGVIVYLSHWFRLEDRSRAKAYFMMTQPLAIAIGVPVSRWILETVHWYGLAGWRWVFILEGLPSVLLGFVTLFYLTDRVHQARWLPDDEKAWLTAELERERSERTRSGRAGLGDALRRPQTYLLIAVFFLIVCGNQALIFFLPSVTDAMKSMSVGARTAFAALPYVCSAVGIVLNGFWSHRTGERRWHTAAPMLLTSVSLSLAILCRGNTALVVTFFCLAGLTSQAYLPVFWTLPTALFGAYAAALSIGLINALGNLGGFVGPSIFGYLTTKTGGFEAGLWCLAGFMFAAGLLATFIRVEER